MDPRFLNDILEQATELQNRYGYGEEKSEAFIHGLPEELKLNIDAELPPRRASRVTTSLSDHINQIARTQARSEQTLCNIANFCNPDLITKAVQSRDEIHVLESGQSTQNSGTKLNVVGMLNLEEHTSPPDGMNPCCVYRDSGNNDCRNDRKPRSKSLKSREWERRQHGVAADILRINNSTRARKSQKRKELRAVPDWQDISPEERSRRESIAFRDIEQRRKGRLEQVRSLWRSKIIEAT